MSTVYLFKLHRLQTKIKMYIPIVIISSKVCINIIPKAKKLICKVNYIVSICIISLASLLQKCTYYLLTAFSLILI